MDISWQTAPLEPHLTSSTVALWFISLPDWQPMYLKLYGLLSADEQIRADRFRFERHRNAFSIARGVLRVVLSQYLGTSPQELPFTYSAQGKPFLAKPYCESEIQFNLSHSHDMAVYALTLGRAIGVDLEHIRPIPDLDQLVKRFFSTQEAQAFEQTDPELKPLAFFRGWTQKEAYLKAIGTGLSGSLDQIEVSLSPHGPAALLSVGQNPEASQTWQLIGLEPASGYVGALAMSSAPCTDSISVVGYHFPMSTFSIPDLV